MKIGEISRYTGYSVAHLRRLARKGLIRGVLKPKNPRGHYRFRNTPGFHDWLEKTREKRMGKTSRVENRSMMKEYRLEKRVKRRAEAAARHKHKYGEYAPDLHRPLGA